MLIIHSIHKLVMIGLDPELGSDVFKWQIQCVKNLPTSPLVARSSCQEFLMSSLFPNFGSHYLLVACRVLNILEDLSTPSQTCEDKLWWWTLSCISEVYIDQSSGVNYVADVAENHRMADSTCCRPFTPTWVPECLRLPHVPFNTIY